MGIVYEVIKLATNKMHLQFFEKKSVCILYSSGY